MRPLGRRPYSIAGGLETEDHPNGDRRSGGDAVNETEGLSRTRTRVVAGIIGVIAPVYPGLEESVRMSVHEDVTRYVASQIQSMPSFLRLPYQLALTAFNWLALVPYRRRFIHLPLAAQASYLALWSDGPMGVMRDFVKLIRSCALLAYFDHPLVAEQLAATRQVLPSVERVAL
jgi:hypothetical protein